MAETIKVYFKEIHYFKEDILVSGGYLLDTNPNPINIPSNKAFTLEI